MISLEAAALFGSAGPGGFDVLYSFENFTLDEEGRQLRKDAETIVSLEPQVFDLLTYLVRHRGRVVSKNEIVEQIWNGRAISDATLDSRLNAVRRALEDSGKEQRLVKTFTRKGVRFIGTVTEMTGSAAQFGPTVPKVLPAESRPAIAVLPFINLSEEPAQEYFADGLTEDLTAALGSWCRFPVIARHSSFVFKGRSIEAAEAGRQLGARYILEGSIRKSGQNVRITARLTDATTGLQLWANRYDHEIGEVFAVQDEITTRIAAAIEPELHRQEQQRAFAGATANPAAYDLVQRGNWYHNRFTAADLQEAQRLFAAAIEADPHYSRAHASMALSKFWAAQMGWAEDRQASLEAALAFSLRAVALDDKDANAHFRVAQASLWLRRQEEALAAARRAVALNPSLVQAHAVLGYALDSVGEFEEAIEIVTHSLRLRPHDRTLFRCLPAVSLAHYQLGDFETAEQVARRTVGLNPNYWMGQQMHAASLGQLDREPEAAIALSAIRRKEPNATRAAYSRRFPFRDPMFAERLEDGLTKAGWAD